MNSPVSFRRAALLIGICLSACFAWSPAGLAGHRVLSVDNHSRDDCLAATDAILFRGHNRGAWWDSVFGYGPGGAEIIRACVRARPYSLDSVFLAWGWGSRSDGLWFTPDGGENWSALKYLLFPSAVALSGADDNFILLGSDTMEQGLWRSTDRGETWSQVDDGLPTSNVRALAQVSPLDPWFACATRGQGLFLTTDGGTSWRQAGPDSLMDVRGVDMDFDQPGYLRVIGEVASNPNHNGIWTSADTGTNWRHEFRKDGGLCIKGPFAGFRQGMFGRYGDSVWGPNPGWPPGLEATCISADYMKGFFYAGSADGVYHRDLTPGTGEAPASGRCVAVRGPTIVRASLVLPATLASHRPLLITPDGRKVMDLQPGENDVRQLAPGVYFIRAASWERSPDRDFVRKIVIQR